VAHSFRYRLCYVCVVLEELPRIARHLPLLFAYNGHWQPFALRDADYLGPGPGSIREKLIRTVRDHVRSARTVLGPASTAS